MTREEFDRSVNDYAMALTDKYAQEYLEEERIQQVLIHIMADGPCGFAHIDNWVKYQLPDGIDTGEIVEHLINIELITFCHSSQSYEAVA